MSCLICNRSQLLSFFSCLWSASLSSQEWGQIMETSFDWHWPVIMDSEIIGFSATKQTGRSVKPSSRFLPHCMECRRSPAILSVRPSVCQTRELWQNGRKIGPYFYTIWKIIYPSFLRPLLPEILGQPTPVGPKYSILNQWSLVAPQP